METIAPLQKRPTRTSLWANLVGKDRSYVASESVRDVTSAPLRLAAPILGVDRIATRMLEELDIAHVRVRIVSAARPDQLVALLPVDVRSFVDAQTDAKARQATIWGYGMPFDWLLEIRFGAEMRRRLGPVKMQGVRSHLWQTLRTAQVQPPACDPNVPRETVARISASVCALLAGAVALGDAAAPSLSRAASMVERGNLPLSLHPDGSFIVLTA